MKPLDKLKIDILRFYIDTNLLESPFRVLKLALVVDFWPVFLFRLIEYNSQMNGVLSWLLKVPLLLAKPFVDGISGARIYTGAKIDEGLLLHQSSGVVIAAEAAIGKNCTFYSGACVVNKANGKNLGAATVGDNVRFFTGCKVIGKVCIGSGVVIGANAVVLKDVPENSIAVGIPSKNIDGGVYVESENQEKNNFS